MAPPDGIASLALDAEVHQDLGQLAAVDAHRLQAGGTAENSIGCSRGSGCRNIGSASEMKTLRSRFTGSSTCRRANASSPFVKSAARSAARWIVEKLVLRLVVFAEAAVGEARLSPGPP